MRVINWLFASLTIFLVIENTSAQDSFGYYLSLLENNRSNLPFVRTQVDSLISDYQFKGELTEIIRLSHHFSKEYYKKRDYKEAIHYGQQEVQIYEQLGICNDLYAKALYNLALFYFRIGDYQQSFELHKQVISANTDLYSTARSYCEIGNYHGRKGDFYASRAYYLQGIKILENLSKNKLLVKKYLDYAHVLEEMNTTLSLDEKLLVLDKVSLLFKKNTSWKQSIEYYSLNNDYANYYNNKKRFNFRKARKYYLKNLRQALANNDSTIIHASYTNLGALYIESNSKAKMDSTMYFLTTALGYARDNRQYSFIYNQMSEFYIKKSNIKKH